LTCPFDEAIVDDGHAAELAQRYDDGDNDYLEVDADLVAEYGVDYRYPFVGEVYVAEIDDYRDAAYLRAARAFRASYRPPPLRRPVVRARQRRRSLRSRIRGRARALTWSKTSRGEARSMGCPLGLEQRTVRSSDGGSD
jgi:hypothetical protein